MADKDYASLVSKPQLVKLTGPTNYRTWSKDMEMVLIRMGCWDVVTEPIPEERTATWNKKNDWARSEIHLWCNPDQQELIIDSTTAYDSWKILKDTCNMISELKTAKLKKEFATASMTEDGVSEYIRRVKKIVSEIRACGQLIKSEDIAYTLLMGLPQKYTPLVITLMNMTTTESPLNLEKVIESIHTEEMRLKMFAPVTKKNEPDTFSNNPLALRHDYQYHGDMGHRESAGTHGAYIARNMPTGGTYRQQPYQRPMMRPPNTQGFNQSTMYAQSKIRTTQPPDSNPTGYQQHPRTSREGSSQVGSIHYNGTMSRTPTMQYGNNRHQYQHQGSDYTDNFQSLQHTNPYYGKQCYFCGNWNHIASTCWVANPELHPRNRNQWKIHDPTTQHVNQANITPELEVKDERDNQANVMDEHPFELNW